MSAVVSGRESSAIARVHVTLRFRMVFRTPLRSEKATEALAAMANRLHGCGCRLPHWPLRPRLHGYLVLIRALHSTASTPVASSSSPWPTARYKRFSQPSNRRLGCGWLACEMARFCSCSSRLSTRKADSFGLHRGSGSAPVFLSPRCFQATKVSILNSSIRLWLLFGLFATPIALTGCGTPSNEAVAPEEFAPPPTAADEQGEDTGG